MESRDYSDSDSEVSQRRSPVKSRMDDDDNDEDDDSLLGDDTPTNIDDDLLMASEPAETSRPTTGGPSKTSERPPRSASSTSQNIRIKIKPPKVSRSQRSSLSPPPPITLKFGVPSRAARVERAAYSSGDDDDEEESKPAPEPEQPKRAHKKPRKSAPTQAAGQSPKKSRAMKPVVSAAAATSASANITTSTGGSHKKSYDWLIPSTAGASHHGPEGRDEQLKKNSRVSGWQPGDTPELDGDIFANAENASPGGGASGSGGGGGSKSAKSAEAKAAALEARRRSHKRRREGEPPGPGKNWRKGMKKAGGKEGIDTPTGTTPTQSRPGSPEGTPEADPVRVVEPREEIIVDETPFVLADAATLGFPVFSKPIVNPKIVLTTFPKVTPYFTPNNGGDSGPFPRREPVRSWKDSERTIVGIGGGTLKFKSWTRGPPSELTLILQAEREAQEAKAKIPKDGTEPPTKTKTKPPPIAPKLPLPESDDMTPKKEGPGGLEGDSLSTPGSPPPPTKKPKIAIKGEGGTGGKKTKSKPKTPRPSMTHSVSNESIASISSQATDLDMGAGAGAGESTPVNAKAHGPRKSKLAQEIRPEDTELVESP